MFGRMLFLTMILGVWLLFVLSLPAKADVMGFRTAYDLQELCFKGNSVRSPAGQIEVSRCESYIEGVLDSIYLASECPYPVELNEIIGLLGTLYQYTPDAELRQTPAVRTLFHVFAVSDPGSACLYPSGASLQL